MKLQMDVMGEGMMDWQLTDEELEESLPDDCRTVCQSCPSNQLAMQRLGAELITNSPSGYTCLGRVINNNNNTLVGTTKTD